MDQQQNYLHLGFRGERVLFSQLRLDSLPSFLVASFLTLVICIFERTISYILSTQWSPFSCTRTGSLHALWKTMLFWVVMLLRLSYMLIAMTFNAGLILVIVTSLSIGQFLVEIVEATPSTPSSNSNFDQAEEPLLHHHHQQFPPSSESTAALRSVAVSTHSRPRSKSKPAQIFIHPSQSNFARADAFALQRGLGGRTELVEDVGHPGSAESWREGKGQEVARELLGHRRSSTSSQFQIGDEND